MQRRRIEYFSTVGPEVGLHGPGSDDPDHPDYVPLEVRGELERARWWHANGQHMRRLARAGEVEFDPP